MEACGVNFTYYKFCCKVVYMRVPKQVIIDDNLLWPSGEGHGLTVMWREFNDELLGRG